MRVLVAFLAMAALTACEKAPTVIDGSSDAAFETSVAAARRDLPYGDRLAFDAAMKRPPGQRYGRDISSDVLRQAYTGMTAADVVADARARGID